MIEITKSIITYQLASLNLYKSTTQIEVFYTSTSQGINPQLFQIIQLFLPESKFFYRIEVKSVLFVVMSLNGPQTTCKENSCKL